MPLGDLVITNFSRVYPIYTTLEDSIKPENVTRDLIYSLFKNLTERVKSLSNHESSTDYYTYIIDLVKISYFDFMDNEIVEYHIPIGRQSRWNPYASRNSENELQFEKLITEDAEIVTYFLDKQPSPIDLLNLATNDESYNNSIADLVAEYNSINYGKGSQEKNLVISFIDRSFKTYFVNKYRSKIFNSIVSEFQNCTPCSSKQDSAFMEILISLLLSNST